MTENPLQLFLDRFGVVILDGAMATELERRGADLNGPLWSAKVLLEYPSLIRRVHYDYFAAGADVATTASYQATFEGFARRGLNHEQAVDLMRLSVRLATEARDEFWSVPAHRGGRLRPLVAASIGCYGASLHDGSEYRGNYGLSVEQLIDFHRPRMQLLAESGADLLACETIPCLVEGEALVRLLAEFPDTVAWLSFSCCDEEHVCHGERFADCVALGNRCEAVIAVGLNCTPPQYVSSLLRAAAGATTKPLLAYPNSGERWDASRRCWRQGADIIDWREAAREWHRLGAKLIGGCCRTTPAQIDQIAGICRAR
jgi:homocysteine S-methyltransferase